MAIRKMTLGLFTAVTLASAAVSLMGCSSHAGAPTDSTPATEAENVGSIGLALQAAPGFTLNSVSYTITGPGGFAKTGSFDVSKSSKISTLIGGLPVGTGYSVTLSAKAVEGIGSCSGSALFNIVARQTTPVSVSVTCHEASRTGSVLINGQLNVCPVVDGVSASTAEVVIGGSVALGLMAHDKDAGPSALSYHWTASSGKLSSDSDANPTFTCTDPGQATISVTVSDGDPTAGCTDKGTVVVDCSPCSGFDSLSAALGELTADCRGRVDPRDYQVTAKGTLVPNFEACGNNPALMLQIRQLLSLQDAKPELLPFAHQCIAGRFQALATKFAASGVDVCPIWTNKQVINPITRENIDAEARLLPVLPTVPPATPPNPPPVPPRGGPLKEQSSYTVTLPAGGANQKCGTPSECAAVCAGAFPGFVVAGPVTAPTPNSIVVDPVAWWSETNYLYDPSAGSNNDPYLMNAAYYHRMSYVAPSPMGEKFGALVRFDPCGGGACPPEACSYWAGTHVRTTLQKYCNVPGDDTTCTSYCGAPL